MQPTKSRGKKPSLISCQQFNQFKTFNFYNLQDHITPTYSEVAEKRTRQLERFLRRLVRSPRLVNNCDLIDFLQLDANLPRATSTQALSASSMKKVFKSFSEILNKIAFPMDEVSLHRLKYTLWFRTTDGLNKRTATLKS